MGREIGVKAPTMLTKSELIEQIISVENGSAEPICAEQRKKGRPPLEKILTSKKYEHEPPRRTITGFTPETVFSYLNKIYNLNFESQNSPTRHEYALQRIRMIKILLEELIDYLAYDGL